MGADGDPPTGPPSPPPNDEPSRPDISKRGPRMESGSNQVVTFRLVSRPTLSEEVVEEEGTRGTRDRPPGVLRVTSSSSTRR